MEACAILKLHSAGRWVEMARKAFEIIDHTADYGIVAYGGDLKQLFANAARALFSLVTDIRSIRGTLQRNLRIVSEDEEGLLVEWLNELIYLLDAEQLLFRSFDIEKLDGGCLEATCYGERIDPSRHKIKVGVKAATYHMLKIDKEEGYYKAQVIFDV